MVSLARPIRSWIYAIVHEMVQIERPSVVEYARSGFELYPTEVAVPNLLDLTVASEWDALPDIVMWQPLVELDKLIRKTIAYAASRHPKRYISSFDSYGMVPLRHAHCLDQLDPPHAPTTPHPSRSTKSTAPSSSSP